MKDLKVFKSTGESLFGKIIPPNLLLPIAILGIIIVVVSTFLEYRSRKNDYTQLLEHQATLFVKTLANTAQNALTAAGELEEEINSGMISGLKLIEKLEQSRIISMKELHEMMLIAQFDEIHLYNAEGMLIKKASADSEQFHAIPANILQSALERKFKEMIFMLPDALDVKDDRMAAIIPRKKGGIIAGIVSAERIRAFRRLFGFGQFLKRFQTGESVEYIVLENPETIVAGIFNGYAISFFADDPFLQESLNENIIKTRILNYDERSIFEAVAPFNFADEPLGILRLGFSMREFELLNTRTKRRMYIFGGVLIVLGLIFLNFVLAYRHRQLLRKDLTHLREYTNVILENLASGVISVDNNGNIQVVNKQASLLLKREYEQLFKKHYTTLPEPFQKAVKDGLENEKSIPPVYHWYTSEGETKKFSLRTSLLKNDAGAKTCILLVDDVTEQARLEEQIRRNEKLTAMRNLSSAVAHEVRNPLNSINLIVDLIKKQQQPIRDIEKYNYNLTTIQNEISRISTIVEEFIQFARPPKMKLAPIDFPVFFLEMDTLFRARSEKVGINITYNFASHPKFYGDYEQLKQVFINLIQNAIEAISPPGKITLTGKTIGERYEISVQDSGCGIPESDLGRVFDIYFTTKKHGSGIGLAIVHQIVSNHDGTIEVESAEGSGTYFVLRFPFEVKRET